MTAWAASLALVNLGRELLHVLSVHRDRGRSNGPRASPGAGVLGCSRYWALGRGPPSGALTLGRYDL